MASGRLCVAFDAPERETILSLAGVVAPSAGMFKVGSTAFIAIGPGIVSELASIRPVFLDLKLHDIPAQVEGAAAAGAALGAELMTVHAAGGPEMVAAAVAGAGDATVVAVTVLTSLSAPALERLGIAGTPAEAALRLGEIALDAGAGGLVCSPLEVAALRSRFGARSAGGPLLVVPGIRDRPGDDDQARTRDAPSAIAAGADLLVVGRPVTAAPDPGAAAAELARQIEAAIAPVEAR